MDLSVKYWPYLLLFSLGFIGGLGVMTYVAHTHKLEAQVSDLTQANQLSKDYIAGIEERDKRNQELQNKLTDLDQRSTKALNEKLTQNDRLRADLATAQRMRLQGTSCPAQPAGDQTGTAGSVGDGAGIELSAETRHAVFDLRASILSDHGKLDYLQRYIRRLGLSPPAKP